jgi:signal transduction histidine kinase
LAAATQSAARAAEPDVATITAIESAEFVLVSGPDIPEEETWEAVELTDRWPLERYEIGREGWYRIKITLDDKPAARIGLFLRRLNMNAELYLNGSLIQSGGQFSEPVARNWNYPMYAEPPRALWRAGDNWIHIRHISYEAYGFLSPLYVGPAAQLRKQYETVYAMQIRVAQFLFPVTLATAFFIFSIWLRRRKDTVYFWFATAVAAWSIYIINMFLRQLVISTKLWEWIAHLSIELWVVAFFVFSYRFVGLSLGRLSWALPAYTLMAAVTYAVGDLAQLNNSSAFFHAVSLMIGFALVVRLVVHWVRAKAPSTVPLTGGLIVLLATGVHDWMFQTGLTSITGTLSLHLHYYCAPLVFVFIAWHLTARYSTAVDDLEDLNLHLAERISDAEVELTDRYDQIKAMEQREAVLHERERIARDIHDTIGGRFSSAIMMTDLIKQQKQVESRLELLREVLADGLTEVRHLVTAMVGDISNTADLIYYVSDKASATLGSVDINLRSTFDLADSPSTTSNLQALSIAKVFQEATNNIIKHSKAGSATLTASDKDGRLTISLADSGVGLPEDHVSEQREGDDAKDAKTYGIAGMSIRCDEIGATLVVSNSKNGGCVVSLSLDLGGPGQSQ